jgi:hypothetical protein
MIEFRNSLTEASEGFSELDGERIDSGEKGREREREKERERLSTGSLN